MRENLRYQFWIVAAAAVIFFTQPRRHGPVRHGRGPLRHLRPRDARNAAIGSCRWFNGEMFPEKPPLMFWTMMAGFELFGVNELGARFFSAVLGVGTALVDVPPRPNPLQRPRRTLGRPDYRLDDHLHDLGPGGHRRFRPDVLHHAGVLAVRDGLEASGRDRDQSDRRAVPTHESSTSQSSSLIPESLRLALRHPDVRLHRRGGAGQGAGGNVAAAGRDGAVPAGRPTAGETCSARPGGCGR